MTAFLLIMAGAESWASTTVDAPPTRWNGGYSRLSLNGDYVTTNSNFSASSGAFTQIPGNGHLTVYEYRPKYRYNFSSGTSFFTGVGGASVEAFGNGLYHDNNNVTEVFGGLDFLLWSGYMRAVLELEGSISPVPASLTTTDALTSDGANYGVARLFLSRSYSWINTMFHGGFKYRDQNLSQSLQYGFAFERPFARSFLMGLGLECQTSIISDTTSEGTRNDVTTRVNGGSHYFYAYNPSYIEPRLWVGWMPDPSWQVKVGYGLTVNGSRFAYASDVFLSLSLNFDTRPEPEGFAFYRESASKSRARGEQSKREFKAEKEKIDSDLFEPEGRFEPDGQTAPDVKQLEP